MRPVPSVTSRAVSSSLPPAKAATMPSDRARRSSVPSPPRTVIRGWNLTWSSSPGTFSTSSSKRTTPPLAVVHRPPRPGPVAGFWVLWPMSICVVSSGGVEPVKAGQGEVADDGEGDGHADAGHQQPPRHGGRGHFAPEGASGPRDPEPRQQRDDHDEEQVVVEGGDRVAVDEVVHAAQP